MTKILVILALIVCGQIFLLDSGDIFTQYRKCVAPVTVQKGDTFDSIALRWFDKDERKGKSWNEFRYDVMSVNLELTQNGRMLTPGDTVYVIYHKVVK